jgi:hypothetical protein
MAGVEGRLPAARLAAGKVDPATRGLEQSDRVGDGVREE